MSVFGAISDIQVDVHHHQAWFSYEDIKLHLHDSIIEVDQALMSFEKFNAAMEQLDATIHSIESMNGMVDEQVMHIVNHDNQLGKLFGIYFPESLRFEMADDNKAGQTGTAQTGTNNAGAANNTATTEEKKQAGESLTDKAKEVAKKMWEMLKGFFAKIAQGLKSFWQWLLNGFMSNKASNEKLLAAINADTDGSKLTNALQQAQGYITFGEAQASMDTSTKILNAPFVKALGNSNCGQVMEGFDSESIWNSTIDKLLGIAEDSLKKSWLKVTAAGEGGLLPTIEIDKEAIKNLKTNKASLSNKEWQITVKEGIIALINSLNTYYNQVAEFKPPQFIELASKYDWEGSDYGKKNKDNAMIKKKCQAVAKFYTQWNKVVLACTDTVQAHFNAIKKYMNVDSGGQKTAQPDVNGGAGKTADVSDAAAAQQNKI